MPGIYLDYNATTPIAPRAQQAMLPFLAGEYGNPSSGHALGRAAHEAVEDARTRVAQLLGAHSDEIVFTSGGTESNNLALKGVCFHRLLSHPTDGDDVRSNDSHPNDSRSDPIRSRGHLVISAVEHPAIHQPARFLERLGFALTVVGVDRNGLVDPAEVVRALRPDTLLVSVMHANNEIGAIQPIRAIADACRARGVLVHTDAAQSVGKVRTRVDELGVDLLTLAGHKLYAPKGVGALYVRRGVPLEPVLHGAGHERGLRAGTENVPYIVALGAAASLADEHLDEAADRMAALRDRLYARLCEGLGRTLPINGRDAPRLPNTLSVNFPRVAGAELLRRADRICASTGAACHSGETHLSATLAAMDVPPDEGAGCVRLSVGWYTTPDEIDAAADALVAAWDSLAAGPRERSA